MASYSLAAATVVVSCSFRTSPCRRPTMTLIFSCRRTFRQQIISSKRGLLFFLVVAVVCRSSSNQFWCCISSANFQSVSSAKSTSSTGWRCTSGHVMTRLFKAPTHPVASLVPTLPPPPNTSARIFIISCSHRQPAAEMTRRNISTTESRVSLHGKSVCGLLPWICLSPVTQVVCESTVRDTHVVTTDNR